MKIKPAFKRVNDSYFWEYWPANRWLFGHISIDLWVKWDWSFWSISQSSANNSDYYCLNMYLGPINVSYTWIR